MFIAHCLKKTETTDYEPITFCVQDHAVSQLITFITRYQQLLNDLNPETPISFQLVSISDVGTSLTPWSLAALGVIEITREKLHDMKQMKLKSQTTNIADFLKASVSVQVEEVDEVITRSYTLPKLEELLHYSDIKGLHPIVIDLMRDSILYLTSTEKDAIEWRLTAGISSSGRRFIEGTIQDSCYLVHKGNEFYLSQTNPIDVSGV